MCSKMMNWETVYIFISSTFNDMHAERDYLVKRVFPELSEWCEERKLRLVDIDLRWGVTEKDSQENKRVVDVCLSNIDRCRPLFLCFLGQRRGWVPGEADIAETTFGNFPKLREHLGSSVTEMEIIHAIIDPMLNGSVMELKNRERAFFFLRDPAYLSDIQNDAVRRIYTNEADPDPAFSDRRLEESKEKIRETGRPVFSYAGTWDRAAQTPELQGAGVQGDVTAGRLTDFRTDGKELSAVILEQLKEVISEIWPGREPSDAASSLQKELDEQARFLQMAREGFIERAGDFDDVRAYFSREDHRPCAVCAEAGMGKTSWLAELTGKLQDEGGSEVLYRFVGTSEGSVSLNSLLVSVAQELRQRFDLQGIPDEPQKIRENLADILGMAAEKKPLILVIDAVNQLDTSLEDLGWIPAYLPDKVKFLYSFKLDDAYGRPLLKELEEENETCILKLRGFDEIEDRRAIVRQYLSLYLKELDEDEIEVIVTSKGASNPLFLKILLSELRMFGSHEGLHEKITNQFGTTPLSAFDALLARLEQDPVYSGVPMKELVTHVLGWLSHSHNGMEPQEAADLLVEHGIADDPETARDSVSLIFRQLRAFLARREKRVDFFYESFQLAAAKRYTTSDTDWHRDLALYFGRRNFMDLRKLSEQAWQYAKAGMSSEFEALLTRYNYLERRALHTGVRKLIDDYELVTLPEAGIPPEKQEQFLLIGEALGMGAAHIDKSISQLAIQLYARLQGFDLPLIRNLLRDTAEYKRKNKVPWLRPLCAFLPQPGGRILRYDKTLVMDGVQVFRDRKRMLIYIPDEKAVKIIRIVDGKVLRNYPLKVQPAWICLAEDEGVFAVREMGALYFIRLDTGERYDAKGITGRNGSQFTLGNGLLVTTGTDIKTWAQTIYVTDIRTGELVYSRKRERERTQIGQSEFTAAIDQETGYVYMTIADQVTASYDPRQDFRVVREYHGDEKYVRKVNTIFNRLWLPAGMSCVVALTEQDGLTIYDKESGEIRFHKTVIGGAMARLCFSDDGKWLVLASFQNISVISLEEYRETAFFSVTQGKNDVSCMYFLPEQGLLYIGRTGSQIEVWDIHAGEKRMEYPDMNWQSYALFPDLETGRLLCIGRSTTAVLDLNRKTVSADRGVTELHVESLAVSPDDTFLIATTTPSDGNIYRMDLPQMHPRVITDGGDRSYLTYWNVGISCDNRYFGATKGQHVWILFDSQSGEIIAEMPAVDVDDTGDIDAQKVLDPQFLPPELCLGERNLTILYHQGGCLVIQDPDAPEKTRVIRTFPGNIVSSHLFDGGRKVAVVSGIEVYDPNGDRFKVREDPSLEDGSKIIDLQTGECLEHTDDRKHILRIARELDTWPEIKNIVEKGAGQSIQMLSREGEKALYSRRPAGSGFLRDAFAVFRIGSANPLCWYLSEDRGSPSQNSTGDGRYIFLRYGYRLCPFRLENVLGGVTDMTNSELDKQAFKISRDKDAASLDRAFEMYEELAARTPEHEQRVKNRDITKMQLVKAFYELGQAGDQEGLGKYCGKYQTLAARFPEKVYYRELGDTAQAHLAFVHAKQNQKEHQQIALELYTDLANRYPNNELFAKNRDIIEKKLVR